MPLSATPWGYSVSLGEGETIQPLLTLEGFHDLTGHKFVSDGRIQSAILATTARFRSHCGWHVAGSLRCVATFDGGPRTLWLPSAHVTSLDEVTVLGEDVTERCEWSELGQLRLPPTPDRLRAVTVAFTSGFAEVPEDLAALVAHRVVHDVALPFGIQQETAGSVSVSYAQSATSGQGVVHLTASDRAALSAYRLTEAR
ncbi:MAG: hypothetical protein IJ092_06930 [Atopobiaceae bacterium]|nr:hypothetical protein [Atopobiaceae bacterium]MBR1829301.1 hypothetical protein [Atopobiaceae bacterium]